MFSASNFLNTVESPGIKCLLGITQTECRATRALVNAAVHTYDAATTAGSGYLFYFRASVSDTDTFPRSENGSNSPDIQPLGHQAQAANVGSILGVANYTVRISDQESIVLDQGMSKYMYLRGTTIQSTSGQTHRLAIVYAFLLYPSIYEQDSILDYDSNGDPTRPGFQLSNTLVVAQPVVIQTSFNCVNLPPLPAGSVHFCLITECMLDGLDPSTEDGNERDDHERDDHEIDSAIASATVVLGRHGESETKSEKVVDGIEDAALAVADQKNIITALYKPVKAAFNDSGAKQALDSALTNFADSIPTLVKALDEIGKIHPFIQVAVLAFKAVYTLEMKRRDNDQKVIVLFVEMRDMIAVLLQLKDVRDDKVVGADGVSIEGRLQDLVKRTADDIKKCGNTCDAYSKMSVIAKVLKGPLWDGVFVNWVKLFSQRRSEFEFALAVHMARKIDDITTKMDDLSKMTETIVNFLKQQCPPEQEALRDEIEEKGGRDAALNNEQLLQELLRSQLGSDSNQPDNDRIQRELQDPTIIIEENFQAFDHKFEMQQKHIIEEVGRIVHRENDRVIEVLTSGPHEKLADTGLQTIWKEMGWRSSVEARRFVLALTDYYQEGVGKDGEEKSSQIISKEDPDAWTLEWITMQQAQSLVEAFDDDASGFITVAEANTFARMRPVDWSFPRWLAYWAIGWQSTATIYRNKIHKMIGRIFTLKSYVHESNRFWVDQYLDLVYGTVVYLTASFQGTTVPRKVQGLFSDYTNGEEDRIRRNLEDVKYAITDLTVLNLITGPGRIERFIFPLIYLLMRRDLAIIKTCQAERINRRNLTESCNNFNVIFKAVDDRVDTLERYIEVYRRQDTRPHKRFRQTACQLYDYYYNSGKTATAEGLSKLFLPARRDNSYRAEDEDEAIEVVLKYSLEDETRFDTTGYYPPPIEPEAPAKEGDSTTVDDLLGSVLGPWTVFFYNTVRYPCRLPFSVNLRPSKPSGLSFEDSVILPDTDVPGGGLSWELTGEVTTDLDGCICCTGTLKAWSKSDLYITGQLNENKTMIHGTFRGEYTGWKGSFFFSRMSPEILSFRPSPAEMRENKTRALWRFACSAIRQQILRERYAWSFFKKRRDTRQRYIELTFRTSYGRGLNADEREELCNIARIISPSDGRYYYSIMVHQEQVVCVHIGTGCRCCVGSNEIRGARTVCLDCGNVDKDQTLDLCEDPECLKAEIPISRDSVSDLKLTSPHVPTHNMFKVRTRVHPIELKRVSTWVREALSAAKAKFATVGQLQSGTEITTQTDQKNVIACINCSKELKRPCWYCFECSDPVFICNDCDAEGGITHGTHLKTHGLVKCHADPVSDVPVEKIVEAVMKEQFTQLNRRLTEQDGQINARFDQTDGRLSGLEGRLGQVEERLAGMDGRLSQVDERLSRMEQMIERLVGKLSNGAPVL
ncbi:uncharacterized protein FIBRA_06857 [Fibroporia radiculosa]|uniref:EF-hand domain-containing protein n=1 Tax=Fibroporia radiculosa TaxID=599839 RepID=J4IBH5_9APHY|nr:uncharacterized protein FIBRA_06857 [Fibroporia radiculosa]CCM04671.1 predicted protein [Fibroporia radiculosa]